MQTIGERLEEARKKKGISIREAAEATKIRGDYLQKFESNQFDIGLTEIYTRGFLRNYANFLKLPAERILNDYAALGRGDVRPRQPNREIYGRMDISVATAGEPSDRAAPPDDNAGESAPGAPRAQPRYPRGSGPTLPSGPDPAVVFKYIKWGGIGVIVLLALLLIKAIFTDRTPGGAAAPRTTNANPATAPSPGAPANAMTYILEAKDPVQVRVNVRLETSDGSAIDGDEIFRGVMMRGERRTITLTVPQTLHASAGENLILHWNGKPIDIGTAPNGFRGMGEVKLAIPSPR